MRAVWKFSPSHKDHAPRSRAGFTLIELMVVIVIIVILIGLVLPAISSARARAREAEVKNDIAKLEQAIVAFKVDFGIEPPSQITLFAAQADWDNAMIPNSIRSKGLIKQIWPRFDFTNCGGAVPTGATTFAPLGSGIAPIHLHLVNTNPSSVTLTGAECLIFFLGGMIDTNSGAFVGFAKDPAHPFAAASQNSNNNAPFVITNRQGPYSEFNGALKLPVSGTAGDGNWAGRLTDKDNDWLPEYKDTLPQQTMPYVYFSASGGSYRSAATSPPSPPAPTLSPAMPYPAWYQWYCSSLSPPTPPTWCNSDGYPMMNFAYFSSFNATNPRMSAPYKPQGFQIISPGSNGKYGIGGLFKPDDTSSLSTDDRDNITNFHSGRLAN